MPAADSPQSKRFAFASAVAVGVIAVVMIIVSLIMGNLAAAGLFAVVLAVGAATLPAVISKRSK